MIRSMTGYGRKEAEYGSVRLIVEMRAVNHRYGEWIVRLPKSWGIMEDPIKKEIAKRVRRGRVEINISIEQNPLHTQEAQLNWQLAEHYMSLSAQLHERFSIPESMTTRDLLLLPGMIHADQAPAIPVEELADWIIQVVEDAADELLAMKETEGRSLALDLQSRLQQILEWTEKIKNLAPQVVEEYRNRLSQRLSAFLKDTSLDEARFAAEVLLFADRSDITEEITRLGSHIHQFAGQLENEDAVGRKLDFLLQEMNREVNTIGSKANYLPIQTLAVEMKTELEKMREQVQNIE
ncbi:YicC/YloC family endoribonuclease [Brevibacillus ginsengisoli]|uniref:YicC/YloC family endoribonuclease n=1 Tax=Brevibacillus ginsengisoli TaxID=363854 RepID=UPI003CF2E878